MDLISATHFNLSPELHQPRSVLKHLAFVAIEGNRQSFNLLQESIHHLSEKARSNGVFTEQEKTFLKTIYACPWWGGKQHGLNEANGMLTDQAVKPPMSAVGDAAQLYLAQMARHYVEGDGQYYPLNLAVYRSSSIVKDTVEGLKNYIRELLKLKKPAILVTSSDSGFLQSAYALKIEAKRKHTEVAGFIFKDGTLMLDQKDPRLMVLGNRFRITAMTSVVGANLLTRWRIEGTYRFENFPQGAAETGLPLHDELTLVLPSCLGVHLAQMGLAKPFDYFADWSDRYALIKM